VAGAAGVAAILGALAIGGCSPSVRYETVARMDETPGNVAVSGDGRIFASLHPFGDPETRVVEVLPGGGTRPFPPGWSGPPDAEGRGIASIIGIECDTQGRLWMLDAGGPDTSPKLVAWDLRTDTLHRVIDLGPAARPASFLQDLAVDVVRNRIYIADAALMGVDETTGRPAIVVVDLVSGSVRRVLEGHPSVMPEDVDIVVEGRPVLLAGPAGGAPVRPRIGINPIELGPDGATLYWGAMNGTSVWRVRTELIADPRTPAASLAGAVVRHGDKPVSDGFGVDVRGNLYITDLGANRIGVTRPDGRYVGLRGNRELLWPDGLGGGPDGYLYVTVNQLHRHAALNGSRDATRPPFEIVRFRPLSAPVVGR
jgi:sugar lactone lactonase YvrE